MTLHRTASTKSLMTFKALYECNNATQAAKTLGITQSGVSRSISLLEKQLQFDLFIRDKNRLFATPEADSLYQELTRMTGALLELEQNISSIREYGASRVRLSSTPGLGFGYAPMVISLAFAGMEKSNIVFDIQPSDEVIRSLESGFTDIGFVTLPVETTLLKFEKIISTQAVCILPKKHPLTSKSVIRVQDFDKQHLVFVSEPNIAVQSIVTLLREKGIKVLSRTECNIAAMCSFIAYNMGIGIINSLSVLEPTNRASEIVIRPFEPAIKYTFALAYRPEWENSQTVIRLRNIINEL